MKLTSSQNQYFQNTGAKRYLASRKEARPHALLPLTYADKPVAPTSDNFAFAMDPRTLKLTEVLATKLNDEFPPDTQDNGFAGPSAVPGNFSAILSVSGQPLDPLPLPIMDNADFIESLGLSDAIKPNDIPFLKEVIRLFFGHATPANLHITKSATTAFPFFTTDNQYKKMGAHKIITNAKDFLSKFNSPGAGRKACLKEYHALPLTATFSRDQPDSVIDGKSKERRSPNEAYARGDRTSEPQIANKQIKDANGKVLVGHFAMRVRLVYANCGLANYFGTAIMACHRAVYLKRFAWTYKVRDDADKESRIQKFKYTVGSDVKNMDTTLPRWFFDFLAEELENYWEQPLIDFLMNMIRATFVSPPPGPNTPDDYNPFFGPDPLTENGTNNVGLPSGVFANPDIGKLWMTFVYVCVLRDARAIKSPVDVEPLLRGKITDHALLDMSDDACFLTNSASVRDYLLTAKSPYALLETERTTVYLGSVFAEVEGVKRSFPNPVTYITNTLARERSITGYHPVAYAEGQLARYQQYSKTPIFRDLNLIYEEEVRKAFGVNPYLIARAVAKMQKSTDIDAMVRANPHYLHYRVDPDDVSPALLDELVSTIPASDIWHHISPLLKSKTITADEISHQP